MTLLILESAGLYWNMRTVMRRVMYCRIHTGIPHTFYSPTGNQPFLPFRIGVNSYNPSGLLYMGVDFRKAEPTQIP